MSVDASLAQAAPPAAEKTIVIAGGGTGGHLFPGLALADELSRRGVRVLFVGTQRGLEATAVPKAGYPLAFIDVAGLKGKGLWGTLRSLLQLPLSLWQSFRLIQRLRPAAVVGVGGYASGPVLLVAALLRLPTAILEQNSIPGLTNRILGKLVRRVVIAFPNSARFFPQRALLPLGNPIRREVVEAAQRSFSPPAPLEKPAPLRVLVLGGSQGAHAVNELVVGAISHWVGSEAAAKSALESQLRIRHQTGAKDRDAIERRYRDLGLDEKTVQVEAFISDMGRAYGECDLVVGRAGATTLAELTAIGRPALLIPFPQAADDHQTENARFLCNQGAAELLPQARTTPAALVARLQNLLANRDLLLAMAQKSRGLGRPEAARTICEQILLLTGAF